MAAGLAALLDDVAAIARVAAASIDDLAVATGKTSAKAAGVIIDDAAVTPRYVQGISSERELPMIWRIARGSLRNKIVFILPIALALSQFLPWLLTPLLMLGAIYLCYEGAEKIWEKISHHETAEKPVTELGANAEERLVTGAIRTDFILSAEIMVISLNEVADQPFLARALILITVAILITAIVYGAVALIVKMDDVGLRMVRGSGFSQKLGRGLVSGMPIVMSVLSIVGIAAMLWVGGYIILSGLKELGLKLPYDLVHAAAVAVGDVLGDVGTWVVNTAGAAVMGIIVGAVVVTIMQLRKRAGNASAAH